MHDQPGIVLEVKGKYQLFDPNTNSYLSTRFIGKRKFAQAAHDGIKWGEEFPGLHQMKIVPEEERATVSVDGVEYPGDVYVYDIGGTVSVVNEVPIEDYLKSVLNAQFENDGLPKEAIAAIAIAARTNAAYQAQNPKNTYWSVEASKVGYEGKEVAERSNAINQAIDETRGMVMKNGGSLFPAEWGSTTGGKPHREKAVFSHITLFDVEEMAKKGDKADKILSKAFPNSVIQIQTP